MNNSKTILVFFFLIAGTLLTTTAVTTMVPAVYADNKQKAEDVGTEEETEEEEWVEEEEIEEEEWVEEEPPEETATLSVCKVEASEAFEPEDFTFTVEGNNPDPEVFVGDNEDLCVDVDIGVGEYTVTETQTSGPPPGTIFIEMTPGGCIQDDNDFQRATGEIQSGETQECRFVNTLPG
jgi:hypothetical protein